MKCRHVDDFAGFLILILIAFVSGENKSQIYRQKNLLSVQGENDIFRGSDNFDSFPDEDFTDAKHHKIVKKQMSGIALIRLRTKRSNSGRMTNPGDPSHNKGSFKTSRKTKKSIFETRNKSRKIKRQSNEPMTRDEHINKAICRIPDKTNCHYYFECEIEPNGCVKMIRKRCPGDQTFSLKYRECIHLSYRKGLCREKRQTSCFFKGCKSPEPPPEGDAEPANEWLDAPQGTNQKIPSEFKPKPKLRLRIYHLRCKKTVRRLPTVLSMRQKRYAQYKVPCHTFRQSIYRPKVLGARDVAHRHHPRSFVVRPNKNPDDQEGLNEENEVDDEEYEDDDEDEEDDNDDDRDENSFLIKNEDEKLNCKEGFKDLFKSAKDPVVGKMKNPDSTFPLESQSQIQSDPYFEKVESDTKKSDSSGDQEKTNKVLIDANIKVDEEISSALKNILSSGMKSKISKKFSEPLIGEISYRNAR